MLNITEHYIRKKKSKNKESGLNDKDLLQY